MTSLVLSATTFSSAPLTAAASRELVLRTVRLTLSASLHVGLWPWLPST